MRRVLTAVLCLSLLVYPALARPAMTSHIVTTISEIGAHYPLFVVKKSYHPENLAVVYTSLIRTATCSRTARTAACPRSTFIGSWTAPSINPWPARSKMGSAPGWR